MVGGSPRSLKARVFLRAGVVFVFTALILFVPAGSFRYWQGWVILAIIFLPMVFSTFYFLKRDPALVERRMENVEPVAEQKRIMRWASSIFLCGLLIPGFDFRFGWSRMPVWLTVFSQFMVLAVYLGTYWVFRTNTFAARTVRVEKEQTVISSGPYRLVRHPMYTAALVMVVFLSTALGSYWAL